MHVDEFFIVFSPILICTTYKSKHKHFGAFTTLPDLVVYSFIEDNVGTELSNFGTWAIVFTGVLVAALIFFRFEMYSVMGNFMTTTSHWLDPCIFCHEFFL